MSRIKDFSTAATIGGFLSRKSLDPKHRGRGKGFSMASTSMTGSSLCLLGGGCLTTGEPDCTPA
ncbi:hypothetical protein A2U01_0025352 [Trifolium medium]|uniref:Uncharacterized protein n=1 Tax=Trifolium medium TaxID=97028 RepID=A0A392P0I1_9FABA|nr:hypothetical protein [Trifolium medium]